MGWIWQHWVWLRSLLCFLSLHFYKSPVSNNAASLGFCFLLEKVSSGGSSLHALKLSCSKYRSIFDSVCFSISSLLAPFPTEVLVWELHCHQLQYCLQLCQRVHLGFLVFIFPCVSMAPHTFSWAGTSLIVCCSCQSNQCCKISLDEGFSFSSLQIII